MEDINNQYHSYLNREDTGTSKPSGDDSELKDFLDKTAELKPAGFTKSKKDIWESIEGNIAQDDQRAHKMRSFRWKPIFSLAAAIALLIVAGVSVFNSADDQNRMNFMAEFTESKTVNLPDGSIAYLNAGSELSYTADWNRTLKLKGEAFFEVTKGEKFTVETAMGQVQVLGTSFNVSDRNKIFIVSCKSGKVKVGFSKSNEGPVFLTKGQAVIFEKDTVKKSMIDISKIADWQKGTFHYVNRPVVEAFDEIKRQYDVKIKITDKKISARPFKGYFFTGDLQTSLALVCEPMGLHYRIDGTTVIIESVK